MKMFVFVILIALLYSCTTTKPLKRALPYSNEVTCIEGISGNSFKYLAWGIGETNQEAEYDAMKAAFYAALSNGSSGGNCSTVMSSTESLNNQEFIEKLLLNDAEWMKFVTNTNNGRIDPGKRLNMENGKIKLGIEVVISTTKLREYLINKGVIKSMRIGG